MTALSQKYKKTTETSTLPKSPARTYSELYEAISDRHGELSKRLQQIARFALDYPTAMALGTVASIAEGADVQPSALIRFAKAFDYGGFTDMQKVFQENVARQSASYKERIQSDHSASNLTDPSSPHELLQQYCAANVVAIDHLSEGIEPESLESAIDLLSSARDIYVLGQRRSYPVATYLTYALSRVECKSHLLDGSGGLLFEQAAAMSSDDVLILTTFHPYSADTTSIASLASSKNVPIISITDSVLSPVAGNSTILFTVHDAEIHSFRSLAASLCVAQTLATGMVFKSNYKSGKK